MEGRGDTCPRGPGGGSAPLPSCVSLVFGGMCRPGPRIKDVERRGGQVSAAAFKMQIFYLRLYTAL